jgi:hypothetical protein
MREPVRTIEEDAVPVQESGEAIPLPGPDEPTDDAELLLPSERRDELRRRWTDVQGSFIDEPQGSVRRADELVQELLRSVAEGFEGARRGLEGEWQRGEAVNTESLRLALRRYRALFERLLAF